MLPDNSSKCKSLVDMAALTDPASRSLELLNAPCVGLLCPHTGAAVGRWDSVMRLHVPCVFPDTLTALRYAMDTYGPDWTEFALLAAGTEHDWKNYQGLAVARKAFLAFQETGETDMSFPADMDQEFSLWNALRLDTRDLCLTFLAAVKAAPKPAGKLLWSLLHGFLVVFLPVAVNFGQIAAWLHKGGLA